MLEDFRSRPDARELFLWEGNSAGHLANSGNAVAADVIWRRVKDYLPPR